MPSVIITHERIPDHWITRSYDQQRKCSKQRQHPHPAYTKAEFSHWVLAQVLFYRLFAEWVQGGTKPHMLPSVDRIDPTKPYAFGNIRLMTWGQNRKAEHARRKTHGNVRRYELPLPPRYRAGDQTR